jgi:hypothetical protein
MEVEIVSQCLRKIDRNKERFVTADAKDVRELLGSSGSSLYECNYVAELRMGNYLSRYDDVIHMLLDDRNNLGERNKACLDYSSLADGVHDDATGATTLRLVVEDCDVRFLYGLDMDAESFKRKVCRCDLTPDDARKILAYAFRLGRVWSGWKMFRERGMFVKALEGKMSANEELVRFGQPLSPVQAELCLALRKEVRSLEEKRKADVEALTLKAAEAYYGAERREYQKKIDAVGAEYGRKIAEIGHRIDEIAVA